MRHLLSDWQVGDGREAALAEYVVTHARPGDVDDVIGASISSAGTTAF
jgi:catechol O-methyltransferase